MTMSKQEELGMRRGGPRTKHARLGLGLLRLEGRLRFAASMKNPVAQLWILGTGLASRICYTDDFLL